ncbi:MAG TPA: hypothetical protein VG204_09290 [Terriglobia bacterium]|nr:hypothetical protein [Terriglobia bacterium]
MKPESQPYVAASAPEPEGESWNRLDRAFRSVLTVSKADLLKAEAKEKRAKVARKRRRSKRG